jgi:hypothetical protein
VVEILEVEQVETLEVAVAETLAVVVVAVSKSLSE